MTQEEKAKAYDEAIEKLHEIITMDNKPVNPKEIGKYLFPELKESEGDRIRKALIRFHKSTIDVDGIKGADILAWLEKQGNLMKALQISNAKIGELIEKNYYLKEQLEKQGNNIGISEATKQKLEDNLNKALKKETPESCNEFLDEQGEQKPADKNESRQEELTEFEKAVKQVMEEAIECGDTHNLKADADMLLRLVQKPAYTKEYDFYGIKFIPKFAKWDIIKDKKSGEVSTIKDFSYDTGLYTHTYGQFPITIQDNYEIIAQNSFWSKEDVEMSRFIGNAITVNDASIYLESKGIQVIDAHVWLEELKERVQPQSTWKPSDEQMNALNDVISSRDIKYDVLSELWKDLKKLKDEK